MILFLLFKEISSVVVVDDIVFVVDAVAAGVGGCVQCARNKPCCFR